MTPPVRHHLFIEIKQGDTDGGIEFLQAGKCHSLYVKVNGTVEELYGILYQSLVFGMTHTGGIDRTAVIFGKSGEIIIDDRLVAVASCDAAFRLSGTIAAGTPSKY